MAVSLPTFPAFQVHLDGNVGPRWKKWLARFENLIVGMGIEEAKQKRALLLHYSGPEVDEIFDTLEGTGEDKDYKTAVEKLTAHFNPQVNTTYEVYNFRKVQPLWPRANGEAERFMPNLEKCVRTAVVEGKNWKQELYKFLRQYRATPHTTTNVSPSEALNGRKLKITLPEVSPTPARQHTLQETQKTMAERDAEQKSKIKAYADSKLGTKPSNIKPGDTVLVRQPKKNKLSTPFNPEPLVVEEKKGSMVTASDGFKSITRNSSMFKIIPKELRAEGDRREQEEPEDLPAEQTEVPTQDEDPNPPSANDGGLRRSQRQRRPPASLADYVQIIY